MSNQQPVVIPLLPIIPALYPMNAQICPIVIAIPSQFGYSANKAKARGIWFDIPPFTAGKKKMYQGPWLWLRHLYLRGAINMDER